MEFQKKLGQRLREAREKLGLSQRDAAKLANPPMNRGTWSRVELGKIDFDAMVQAIRRYVEALGGEVEIFLPGEDEGK